ncbi:MAT1-2-1, partial [Bisporella sp. PMI_857]
RVRRPPNAFILFRLDMHPMVVAQEPPGTTNNQISRIIGAMWARAPAFLRGYYGAEAEARKVQHALSNPGYRYHPRKPSEVKRRMTKRK